MNAIIAISGMIPAEIAFEMLGRTVDKLEDALKLIIIKHRHEKILRSK